MRLLRGLEVFMIKERETADQLSEMFPPWAFGRCMSVCAKIMPSGGSQQLFPHLAIRLDTKGASMKLPIDCAFSSISENDGELC
jgi:hypothetical protein